MKKIIEKEQMLIEALPYIQRFRGETVVVKFGGSIMDNEDGIRSILRDIALMGSMGMQPVIVHGGGKAISKQLKEAGIPTVFIRGLRKTDAASVKIVEQVLNYEINPQLVKIIEEFGYKARGMHGDDLLRVVKHTEVDEQTGETLDWDFVGDVTEVDIEPIKAYQAVNIIPVITPVGRGPENRI